MRKEERKGEILVRMTKWLHKFAVEYSKKNVLKSLIKGGDIRESSSYQFVLETRVSTDSSIVAFTWRNDDARRHRFR